MLWVCALLLSLLRPSEVTHTSPVSAPGSSDASFDRLHRDVSGGQNATGPRVSQDMGGDSLSIDTLLDTQTQIVEDSHNYYTSRVRGPSELGDLELWEDLLQGNGGGGGKTRVHSILSNTHRQASRVVLSFDFPFYGHHIRQITIATGGFIFMGDVVHRMLTATQYVAPLMANFNPSYSRNSTISYRDNGAVFVVQWDKVHLHEKEDAGGFTFQAALHRDGRIVFGYKEIPLLVPDISPAHHPVKAGLSDAFMVLNPSADVPESRKRTIFEYHRLQLSADKIRSRTVVEFTPLPTCLQQPDCEQCVTAVLSFNCTWCHVLQRCSSGFDRHRQDWVTYGCEQEPPGRSCEALTEPYVPADPSLTPTSHGWAVETTPPSVLPEGLPTEDDTKLTHYAGEELQEELPNKSSTPMHSGTIVGIVLAVLLITVIILAAIYINRYPGKQGARCCVQHRPHYWAAIKFHNHSSPSVYSEVSPTPRHEKDSFVEEA